MSAFVVGKPHIDALVTMANLWSVEHAWPSESEKPIVQRWLRQLPGNELRFSELDTLGRELWTENLISVLYRYPDATSDDLPGPCDFSLADAALYQWTPRRPLTAVETLKAINCYSYQSCEHPEWEHSAAFVFCRRLRDEAISRLPGYSDAAWEITERAPVVRVV